MNNFPEIDESLLNFQESRDNKENKCLLAQLEDACKEQDWYYDYSDDHQVWKAGAAKQSHIDKLRKECNSTGLASQAKEIINKYKGN